MATPPGCELGKEARFPRSEAAARAPFNCEHKDGGTVSSKSRVHHMTPQHDKPLPLLIEPITELSARVDALAQGRAA